MKHLVICILLLSTVHSVTQAKECSTFQSCQVLIPSYCTEVDYTYVPLKKGGLYGRVPEMIFTVKCTKPPQGKQPPKYYLFYSSITECTTSAISTFELIPDKGMDTINTIRITCDSP